MASKFNNAKTFNKSSATSTTNTTRPKKIIKPLKPSEFNPSNVEYSNVIVNTDLGNKWINTTIANENILIVARGCIIKTFKKLDTKDNKKLDTKTSDKFQVFMGITDKDFIKTITEYDDSLIQYGVKNSKTLFDDEMTETECREMFTPKTLNYHEKYGYAIGCQLSKEFKCDSKTEDVTDTLDLTLALAKNTIVDVCFWLKKIKLGVGKYSAGLEITKINITGLGSTSQYKSNAITPDEFVSGKITLTEREVLEKGAKKCKILYGDGEDAKPLRFKLENIIGRIFENKQPGDEKVSYSLSIRLTNPSIRKMIETIDEEIFKILLEKSKEYYDAKKTSKLLRPIVKSLLSFNKADQEKIKKGEKPTYEPSLWIKIYHSDEKGFDGKIVNTDGNKPMNNTNDLINKDLTISSLEIYSKHIWFGPKGTSINFTLNECGVSFDVPDYDMDNIETTESVSEDEEVEEVAANSDDE